MALQQLVEIARALNRADVRLLILDEPTAALSESEAGALAHRLRLVRESGVHVLYITHLLHEVLSVADRVTVIRDGRVAFTSDVKSTSYEELVAAISPTATGAAGLRPDVRRAEIAIETDGLVGDRFGPLSLAVHRGRSSRCLALSGQAALSSLRRYSAFASPLRGPSTWMVSQVGSLTLRMRFGVGWRSCQPSVSSREP